MTLSSVIREDPCEFLGAITSFVTFLSDLLTDLTVAGFYFYYGHLNWGLLTLLLIFVPGMIDITSLSRHKVNGGASFRWSFGPHSAWGSIESTTILTTHPSLLCNNAKFQVGLFHSFHYTGKKKTKSQRHVQCI